MSSQSMQRAALRTRDAHLAMLDLKRIVDSATERVHAAELEATGLAIGRSHANDPLKTLRLVADTLRSSDFEAAVLEAKAKMETAVSSHLMAAEQ
jgi:hypothetical protein